MGDITFAKGYAAYLQYSNFRYTGTCSFFAQVVSNPKRSKNTTLFGVQLERLNAALVRMEMDFPKPELIILEKTEKEDDETIYSFKDRESGIFIPVRPIVGNIDYVIERAAEAGKLSGLERFEPNDIQLIREIWPEIVYHSRKERKHIQDGIRNFIK